ncbi:hypothetical protein Q361_1191 [Flavobacterium croceum DSM 17960]|uniref:Lipoprotein n=1 Tax=Flavobacterium croceum DSM 17960 TaxID=1121886 RepID=A0A2S4N6A9_9FLAO|nr:hypothetical protein [Flavobacterium croceum]POS00843.1 hypothetical protein Q361_1191 [Flavobacterium croceum DSM 17960]
MKNKINFIITLLLFIACQQKDQPKKVVNKNLYPDYSKKYLDYLKKSSIDSGNTYSYGELLNYYSYNNDSTKMEDFCQISKTVADKYSLCDSNFEVYKIIIRINNKGIYHDSLFGKLPKEKKEMAFSYIKKGIKENNPSCLGVLEMLYRHGYGVPKSKKKSDSLYNLFYKKYDFYPSKIGREN